MLAPIIIVVHDETPTRELAVGALCAAGLPAVGFDDPMNALAAIEADARLRVLVTRVDFGRGKLNGAALARMLRHKQKDVRTVFVARPQNRIHAEKEGEFLPTPLNISILVETVARLLTEAET
jgi:DNA-binding NtrC family response regulator